MQLVAFSVTNYRSIKKAKLPLRQNTVLIGPNNEGKSNILRALVTALETLSNFERIRLLHGRVRSAYLAGNPYEWETDFPIGLQAENPNGESIFHLDFELSPIEIGEFRTEVKSSLDGTLPIDLSLGKKAPGFRVRKKGPGAKTLSGKAEAIAQFIAKRININHIPAVRTADSAHRIVLGIVEKELSQIEAQENYRTALSEIEKIQAPVLAKISKSIEATLREFLPKVKDVIVSIPQEARNRALRRSCEIIVNDGTPTQLARKGDGVQSLAALSLMRHASETSASGRNLILAIEEPESHLHPLAIHQLKAVLAEIGRTHQVIMTTHSPLFVDRTSLKSNILVDQNKAAPAKNVLEIRKILGVRASDNLRHAELVLLVEGEADRRALSVLLQLAEPELKLAMAQGSLAIDTLLGGSNLAYKLSHMRDAVCSTYIFLDYDQSGMNAFKKAEAEGLCTMADATFTICPGMKESEIEDIYDESLYANMLMSDFGVPTSSPKFKGTRKWSERARDAFQLQGKPWTDEIKERLKIQIAELVESKGLASLNAHKRSSFDSLVGSLRAKLKALADIT